MNKPPALSDSDLCLQRALAANVDSRAACIPERLATATQNGWRSFDYVTFIDPETNRKHTRAELIDRTNKLWPPLHPPPKQRNEPTK